MIIDRQALMPIYKAFLDSYCDALMTAEKPEFDWFFMVDVQHNVGQQRIMGQLVNEWQIKSFFDMYDEGFDGSLFTDRTGWDFINLKQVFKDWCSMEEQDSIHDICYFAADALKYREGKKTLEEMFDEHLLKRHLVPTLFGKIWVLHGLWTTSTMVEDTSGITGFKDCTLLADEKKKKPCVGTFIYHPQEDRLEIDQIKIAESAVPYNGKRAIGENGETKWAYLYEDEKGFLEGTMWGEVYYSTEYDFFVICMNNDKWIMQYPHVLPMVYEAFRLPTNPTLPRLWA